MTALFRRIPLLAAATLVAGVLLGCASMASTSGAGTKGAAAPTGSAGPAPMAVGQAGAFAGSIGINVHFNYYGSIYTDATPLMIEELQSLGVTHLRDALCWQGPEAWNTYYTVHQQLGSLGFKTDYIASINQPMSEIAAYPALVTDMEAIEPANEYDNSGDPNWATTIAAQQSAIRSAIAAGVTVLAPSLAYPGDAPQLGSLGAAADAGNLHGYFGGYNPGNAASLLAQVQPNTPQKPVWVTETGYFAAPGAIFGMNGVTPAIQAVYSQRALLEYWNAGAARTYLYELADDVEPGQNSANFQWGLLDSSGAEKPSFVALRNLLQLLGDPGPAFTPAPLAIGIAASASTVHYTLLGKRDGTYYLALWNEVQSYDFVNNAELETPAQSVTLTLGQTPRYSGTQQFDEAGNYTTTTLAPAQTLMLPVTDRLQIVSFVF